MPVSFPGLGIELFVDPVAFSIGPLTFHWYGLLIAISFICGLIYTVNSSNFYGIKDDDVINLAVIGTLGGFVGARIYYVIFAWEYFADNPLLIFNLSTGGLAIYGGVIAAIGIGWFYCKKKKISLPGCLDLLTFAMLISHTIGRWGNFANQEAFGAPTSLPWGMVSENTGNVAVHPCFLYESLWCFIGFIVAHFVIKKVVKQRGQTFAFYVIWYGFGRAIIEGLRSDSLYLPFSIFGYTPRVSQILSIAMVVGGIVALYMMRNKQDLPIAEPATVVATTNSTTTVAKKKNKKKKKKKH